MIIEDLRAETKSENTIVDSNLEKRHTGIPTGNIVLTTNLGFKVTILRQEAYNIASYLVGLDKAIEEAEEALEKAYNLPLYPDNAYSRDQKAKDLQK